MITRRALTLGGVAALGSLGSLGNRSAAQQVWPTKPVTLIAPFAAGGTADVLARLLAERLSQGLGQQVVVENQGGAGGTIGAATVARAEPDGHTLLLHTVSTAVVNPLVYTNLTYDAIENFAPISLFVRAPLVLVVSGAVEAHTLQEFVDLCRASPGEISYASPGVGSVAHLMVEVFRSITDIDIIHVPYRGAAAAVPDLIANRVSLIIDGLPTQLPMIRDGQVRALGVTTAERSDKLPDVPAISEVLPGYDLPYWAGLFAPSGTPRPIIEQVNAIVSDAMKEADFQERLDQLGMDGIGSTPEELDAFWRHQLEYFAPIVEEANISL